VSKQPLNIFHLVPLVVVWLRKQPDIAGYAYSHDDDIDTDVERSNGNEYPSEEVHEGLRSARICEAKSNQRCNKDGELVEYFNEVVSLALEGWLIYLVMQLEHGEVVKERALEKRKASHENQDANHGKAAEEE